MNGSNLLKCTLRLTSKNGKGVRVWLKNISSQTLVFKDFRRENLVLNDLASSGEYFEANEIKTFYLYPSESGDILESFSLKLGEEKTFRFPVSGCRFRKGHGIKLFDDKVEEKLNFKPEDVKIMNDLNYPYHFLGIAVYFYCDGKKYKAIDKEFVDSLAFTFKEE